MGLVGDIAFVALVNALGEELHGDGALDQGYGRGGTPIFTGVFEPLARVALYPTDEDGLGTWFGEAWITFALRIDFVNVKHKENVRFHRNKGVTRASDP